MGCGAFFTQLNDINQAIGSLSRLGFLPDNPTLTALNKMRGELLGRQRAGQALPRISSNLRTISGLSPGEVTVFYELETGFFTDGRPEPGDKARINFITPEQAARLLQPDPDIDLAHELMIKSPDIDN